MRLFGQTDGHEAVAFLDWSVKLFRQRRLQVVHTRHSGRCADAIISEVESVGHSYLIERRRNLAIIIDILLDQRGH